MPIIFNITPIIAITTPIMTKILYTFVLRQQAYVEKYNV